ncbi:hypothetical protein [Micromonospora sp. BL4]|uniref:hypothetical protein n=1 Tax=Micromonospora sp. BL4 TaxID=2478710 RepID=UPI0013155E43|nr:hypothetical protein [Micromonospora sp. BL4]
MRVCHGARCRGGKAVSPGAPVDAWVRSIREQNAAVTAMVAQVRGLGRDLLAGDRPTSA